MKICPKCGNQVDDNAVFCPSCGTNFSNPYAAPAAPEWDHTAEFDPADVSDNKVMAMLVYLMDVVGVIIAALAVKDSAYVKFHIRQSLKFTVIEALCSLAIAFLCWTVIVPIAGALFIAVLWVVKIICFVSVCKNEAKEPAIIRSFGFLK